MTFDRPMGKRITGSAGAEAVTVSDGICVGGSMGFSTGARDGCVIFRSTGGSASGSGARASATSMICCNAVASAAVVRIAAGSSGALASVCDCWGGSTRSAGIGALGVATAAAFALASGRTGARACHWVTPYTAVAISRQAALGSIQWRLEERGGIAGCRAVASTGAGLRGLRCAAGSVYATGPTVGDARRAFRTSVKSEL
jgi:hypothetical protein